MKACLSSFALIACLVAATALPAAADGIDGYSFAGRQDPARLEVRPAVLDGQRAGDLPIQLTGKSSKKPNVFQRMGKGTKNLFNSTKNAMSFKKKPAPTPAAGVTSTWRPKQASQEKQGSWWGSLFQKKPERQEPQTMKEWMSQERPKF